MPQQDNEVDTRRLAARFWHCLWFNDNVNVCGEAAREALL
jgi:hypothetical protein